MYRQRFPFEILIRAVLNPRLEEEAENETQSQPGHLPITSWRQTIQSLPLRLYQFITKIGERTVLPKVFHKFDGLERDEVEIRLREALAELRSIALIDHIEEDDSYSMHPLVHWWARERMSQAEQAVWCQSACNILAHAVLLPPLGVGDTDTLLRMHALPHIEHMRKQGAKIQKKIRLKQRERKKPWPALQQTLRGSDIRQYAKFSLVYAESGQWKKASELLLVVDKFLSQNLGLGHPIAIRARLFLSESYLWLGDEEKAANLQFELLEICKTTCGEDDTNTLNVMDRLGMSLWQQSKYQEARDYHRKALEGFQKMHSADHADTFRAMTHLGRVVAKLAEFDEAVRLHTEALQGLRRDRSRPRHDPEILEVMHDLAGARFDRYRIGNPDANDMEVAKELQIEVVGQREAKLGKEHPLTLWAYLNLARISAELGAVEEAEDMIRTRLPIAERNLGETHFGPLFGKVCLGRILILRNKISEAEDVLEYVAQEYEKNRRNHPDQLVAVAFLIECYKRQGKITEALPLQKKVIQGARHIFGEGSRWEEYFLINYC